jgi:hypothetical protein
MKFRPTIAYIVVLVIAFAVVAPSAYCKLPKRDEIYQNKLETDAWKRLIEKYVIQQQAGQKPPVSEDITWKDFWISWYSFLRHQNPGLPWKGSEFKSADDMIRYIKQRLKTHGLPTYE